MWLVGVYDPALTETIANVMGQLGVKRALVVSAEIIWINYIEHKDGCIRIKRWSCKNI